MEKMLSVVYLIPSTTFPSPPEILPVTEQEQEEKGTTENQMVGWHHRLNGHEFG